MKPVLLFFLFCLFASIAFSQKTKKFEAAIGVATGLPVGTLSKNLKPAIGANLQGEYFIAEKISIGASASYLFFDGKNKSVKNGFTVNLERNSYISLFKVGGIINYKFSKKIFGGIDAGMGFFKSDSSRTTETTIIPSGSSSYMTATKAGDKGNGFFFSPHIGYNRKYLQFILSYTSVNNAYPISLMTSKMNDLSYIGFTINYKL